MCKLQTLLIIFVWLCPADTSTFRQRSQKLRQLQPNTHFTSSDHHVKTNSQALQDSKIAGIKPVLPLKHRWTREHVGAKKKKQFIIAGLAGLADSNPYGLADMGTRMGFAPQNYGGGLVAGGSYGNSDASSLDALGAAGSMSSYPAIKSTLSDYTTGAMGLNSMNPYGNGMQGLDSSNALGITGNSLNGGALATDQMANTQGMLGAESSNSLLGASTGSMLGGGSFATGLSQSQAQPVVGNNDLYNIDQSLAGKINMAGMEEKLGGGGGRQGIGSSLSNLGLDSGTLNELGQLGVGGGGGGGEMTNNNNGYSDGSLQQILGKLLLSNNGMGGSMGAQGDGQLNGQLDGQLNGQLNGQLDGQLGGQLSEQLGGQLNGQLGGQLGEQLGGQLGGHMGGQLDGQMDGQLGGHLNGHISGSQTGAGAEVGNQQSIAGRLGLNALLAGAGHYGQGNTDSEASEDAQPSSDADEQVLPGLMHHPMAIAPIVPGQTVHVHTSDKPKAPVDTPSLSTPAANALKVQLKANSEHEHKLKILKLKLKRLREKLMRLKSEYSDSGDINEKSELEKSQKSEMQTLKDLKKAAEEAITELKLETGKFKGAKGSKKLIFIHKFPDTENADAKGGTRKDPDLEALGSDLLALIEPTGKTSRPSAQPKIKQKSNNKGSLQDDTQALTELAKQAEQEVNALTSAKRKNDTSKQGTTTQGASMQGSTAQGASVQGLTAQGASVQGPTTHGDSVKVTTTQGASIQGPTTEGASIQGPTTQGASVQGSPKSLPGTFMNPKPVHGFQQPLNPVQLNNLAQILPEPEESERQKTPRVPPTLTANSTKMLKDKDKGSPGYFSIGCWRDQPERALSSLEGIFPILDGNNYKNRKFAIKKCSIVARMQGFSAFALENGGHCLAGKNTLQTYNMYGPAGACKADGRGGPWSMEVYKFTVPPSSSSRRTRISQRHQVRLRGMHLIGV